MKKRKKGYWYKRYVEERFSALSKIDKMRANSLKLQAKEYERRLMALNGEADRLRNMQATYVPREVFENSIKSVSDKTEELSKSTIKPMQEWQYKLQGKLVVIIIVGGAIWGIVVGIMFYFLNKI